jgi:hypothetical protein
MKMVTLTLRIGAAALVLWSATASFSAQVSFSAKAPAVGTDDISNLTGADTPIKNVSDGDNDATYIADDRPVQGQTFTTGTNAAGYLLRAVTLREVKHETYSLVPDLTYTLRITKRSGGSLLVIATESAEAAAAAPGNIPSISNGDEMASGSGEYITFTLDKPVLLKANSVYGFDLGGGNTRHYWQTDGTSSNAYAGGEAYSSGTAGVGSGTRTVKAGDHVFVAALSRANAPLNGQAKTLPENKPSTP